MGLSPPARYSVILMRLHLGSSAAWAMKLSTLLAKLSYGWCTSSARSRMTEKMLRSASSARDDAPGGDRRPRLVLQLGPVERRAAGTGT